MEIQNEYVDSIKLQLSELENVGGCYNEANPNKLFFLYLSL